MAGRFPAPTQPCEQPTVVAQPNGLDRWPTARLCQHVLLDHDHVRVVWFCGRRRDGRPLCGRRFRDADGQLERAPPRVPTLGHGCGGRCRERLFQLRQLPHQRRSLPAGHMLPPAEIIGRSHEIPLDHPLLLLKKLLEGVGRRVKHKLDIRPVPGIRPSAVRLAIARLSMARLSVAMPSAHGLTIVHAAHDRPDVGERPHHAIARLIIERPKLDHAHAAVVAGLMHQISLGKTVGRNV